MTPVRFRFADSVRTDAAVIAETLKRQGFELALLSGDRQGVVDKVADEVGISTRLAGLKPSDKIAWLGARASEGRKVPMVGDGLNDAPALAARLLLAGI